MKGNQEAECNRQHKSIEALLLAKKFVEAEAEYDEVYRQFDGSNCRLLQCGILTAVGKRNYGLAVSRIVRALKIFPEDSGLLQVVSKILPTLYMGKVSGLVAKVEDIFKQHPTNGLRSFLVECYDKSGEFGKMLALYEQSDDNSKRDLLKKFKRVFIEAAMAESNNALAISLATPQQDAMPSERIMYAKVLICAGQVDDATAIVSQLLAQTSEEVVAGTRRRNGFKKLMVGLRDFAAAGICFEQYHQSIQAGIQAGIVKKPEDNIQFSLPRIMSAPDQLRHKIIAQIENHSPGLYL